MAEFGDLRRRMVERDLAGRGITDRLVLDAMAEVPREAFVPADLREFAYEDSPLPIAAGQTISQPYIVARMIQALELEGGERVLDIGTGSGYAAAVLSRIADRVYTIERHVELYEYAVRRFEELGYHNIEATATGRSDGPKPPRSTQSRRRPGGRRFRASFSSSCATEDGSSSRWARRCICSISSASCAAERANSKPSDSDMELDVTPGVEVEDLRTAMESHVLARARTPS